MIAEQALRFRDPKKGRALAAAIARVVDEIGRDRISVMHVCGSHEQAIARFGLRATFPPKLDVIMGPGCPVCITDIPEVDEAYVLAKRGVRIATYGDMLRVPGTGGWEIADVQFLGDPVTAILPDFEGATLVGLDLGHFGAKLWKRDLTCNYVTTSIRRD